MTKKEKKMYTDRLKSFAWRAGVAGLVAGATYILKIGDLWQLDPKTLTNLSVMAVLVFAINEYTKYVNDSE